MLTSNAPKGVIYKREFINEDGELERQCARCEESWYADTEFFHRCPKHPRGLHIYCKVCMSRARRQSYLRSLERKHTF